MRVERRTLTTLDDGNITDNPKVKRSSLRHWHKEIEFVLVKNGNLLLEHSGDLINVSNNQLFFIASNVPHAYLKSDESSVLYVLKLVLDKRWNYSVAYSLTMYESSMMFDPNPHIEKMYMDMMRASFDKYTDLYIVGKVYEFFAYIYTSKVVMQAIKTENIGSDNVVTTIYNFMVANITNDISLEDIARHLGLSKNYCSKIIKEKTTLGFSQYLNNLRVKNAENLLIQTDMDMISICYDSGFKTIQSFNRNFKDITGVSPTDFRKIYT